MVLLLSSIIGCSSPSLQNNTSASDLVKAAGQGDFAAAEALLNAGAPPNASSGDFGVPPIVAAADGGHLNVVVLLVKKGADVNAVIKSGGDTALTQAAAAGHYDIVRFLISNHADVNHANDAGMTPLLNAAWRGHLECVQALLDARADVSVRDRLRNRNAVEWAENQAQYYQPLSKKRTREPDKKEALAQRQRFLAIVEVIKNHY